MKKINLFIISILFGLGIMQSCSSSDNPAPIVATFSASQTIVLTGNSVSFTDESTGSPTTWNWTFDNGNPTEVITSTEQNPTITFPNFGLYTATLVAGNGDSENTLEKADFIQVNEQSITQNTFGSSPGFGSGGSVVGNFQTATSFQPNLGSGNYYIESLDIAFKGAANSTESYRVLFCQDSAGFPAVNSAIEVGIINTTSDAGSSRNVIPANKEIAIQSGVRNWILMEHAEGKTSIANRGSWLLTSASKVSGTLKTAVRDVANGGNWFQQSATFPAYRVNAIRSAK